MFVTFYSYKGGVGRTLALANVAYLMATDKEEPCRVLLWDFDLEAPGLHHLFPPQWGDRPQGFVDCVHHYVTRAELPQIDEYIHHTGDAGVDILPAGRVDDAYTEKLEGLQWPEIYDIRRGYDFIDAMKQQIAELKGEEGRPLYDYVLVDARTGYSDVGGICVRQLPDVVVLMFRPDDQNLAGIGEVNQVVRSYEAEPDGRAIGVLPVLGPLWPFAAPQKGQYLREARAMFPAGDLATVSFEASLTYGAALLTREVARGNPEYQDDSPVCGDYRGLAAAVRRRNPNDALTLKLRATEAERNRDFLRALSIRADLVRRRPSAASGWDELQRVAIDAISGPAAAAVTPVLDGLAREYPNRARAHEVSGSAHRLAALWDQTGDHLAAAEAAFSRALELEPTTPARLMRAFARYQLHDLRGCLEDCEQGLASTLQRGPFLVLQGHCLLDQGKHIEALAAYDAAAAAQAAPPNAVVMAAQAAFKAHLFEAALERLDREEPPSPRGLLLRCHVLCALGTTEGARAALQRAIDQGPSPSQPDSNVAEAWLAVGDAHNARLALMRGGQRVHPWTRLLLSALTDVLRGRPDRAWRKLDQAGEMAHEPRWSLSEIESMLECGQSWQGLPPDVLGELRRRVAELAARCRSSRP